MLTRTRDTLDTRLPRLDLPTAGDDLLAEAAAESDRFLAQADAAIERALSRNSEAFLRGMQQSGGQ